MMRRNLIGLLVIAAAACGDPETNDNRGYTKAPLEQPTVLVRGEKPSEMSRLGDPILPAAPIYEAEQPADSPQAAPGQEAKPAAPAQVPAGATAADVEEGQKIFAGAGNCYTCHGQAGGGSGMAPTVNDAQWLNIDGSFPAIQQIVKSGVPAPKQFPAPMPAMGGAQLTDQQVKQVAAYIYSISR